jgi:hypothetical protein
VFVAEDGAGVVDGYLIPGKSYLDALISALRSDVTADPQLRERWDRDPRGLLGERGISLPIQNELLADSNKLSIEEAEALEADCSVTCVTTSCCVTVFL